MSLKEQVQCLNNINSEGKLDAIPSFMNIDNCNIIGDINDNKWTLKAYKALQNRLLEFSEHMSEEEQVQCLNNINSEGKLDAIPSFMNIDNCNIIGDINDNKWTLKAYKALQNRLLEFSIWMSSKEQVQCLNNIDSEGKFNALPSFMNNYECNIIGDINDNKWTLKAYKAVQNRLLEFSIWMSSKEQVQCLNNIDSEGKFDALPSFMNSDDCNRIAENDHLIIFDL